MPRYRLTADAFVAGTLHHKGEVVDWDGPQGRAMQPIDPPATAKAAKPAKANPDQDA